MTILPKTPKQCDAPDCIRVARSVTAKYCDLHRQRMAANGTLDLSEPKPVAQRFWAKVERRGPDECWPWLAAIDRQTGYGRIGLGGRGASSVGAHRVAYELQVGPIPVGLTIDHLCCNRTCMNPRHLEAVTHEENSRRAKRRWTHCKHGHEFTPENTYWRKEGRRACRACRVERRRAS